VTEETPPPPLHRRKPLFRDTHLLDPFREHAELKLLEARAETPAVGQIDR